MLDIKKIIFAYLVLCWLYGKLIVAPDMMRNRSLFHAEFNILLDFISHFRDHFSNIFWMNMLAGTFDY